MRRKDREVTTQEGIENIIKNCKVLRLGLTDGRTPYVVPLNFGYALESGVFTVYVHCAKEGRKIDMLQANQYVCVEFDNLIGVVEVPAVKSYTSIYESVIGFGTAEFVQGDEKAYGLSLIVAQSMGAPGYTCEGAMLDATAVIKIKLDEVTGKRNRGPAASE